jgi:hypothetical protein
MICKGIHPFSFQKDVIDEVVNAKGTGKKIVVRSRRQIGKSTLIANLLLYYAINFDGTKNYCVSPTLKQGKKLYKSVVKALTKAKIIKSANGSDLSIVLKNESEINFKSAEQNEALRGETVTGLLCIDEMAYIPDYVYDIIRPWTDFHKAVTLMVSTPFVKEGYFWTYYNYGLEKSHNTVLIDWADYEKYKTDLDKILPPEQLDEYKAILPKKVFLTEYLGQFIEGGGLVFDFFKEAQRLVSIQPKDKLYIGIDWSNQANKDYTVVSMINQNCEQVKLAYWNDLTPLKQIDKVYAELEPYLNQIQAIVCETNSLGTPYTDLLRERLQDKDKIKIKEFVTSNTSKNDLVGKMQVALEQGTISLLPDNKQEREFSYYAAEYNPTTKNITYNAPSGLNDDTVMATMFALYGFNEYKTTGVYSIGTGSLRRK